MEVREHCLSFVPDLELGFSGMSNERMQRQIVDEQERSSEDVNSRRTAVEEMKSSGSPALLTE